MSIALKTKEQEEQTILNSNFFNQPELLYNDTDWERWMEL